METYVFELPQKLNMSIELSELRFRLSCMDGNIDYAKKLLSENANINNFDDAFFEACCERQSALKKQPKRESTPIDASRRVNRRLKC